MAVGKSARPEQADLGLLLVRLGVGTSMLVFHGWSKVMGGPALWGKIGGEMSHLGIHFLPSAWGFLSAMAEALGSALLILGLLFRPATAVLAINMFVASIHHTSLPGDAANSGWNGASHALELLSVYLCLLLTGPGRFSLAPRWHRG